MNKMKLFVTGTEEGQVVNALVSLGKKKNTPIITCGLPELDLADNSSETLNRLGVILDHEAPDIIVNVAAYTAVDKAEEEEELAFAINHDGAGMIAAIAARKKLPIIQISTDYVFSGEKREGAYKESEATGPISVYGKSKLGGEKAVARTNWRHAILRTSWVYSTIGHNFLKTMLHIGALQEQLNIVADQFGAPTHADAIASGIFQVAHNLIEQPDNDALYGIFHMTNKGATNWYGFAKAIFKASADYGGPNPKINAIPTEQYPTSAKRPTNSRLDCSKISDTHHVKLAPWEEAIAETVRQVLS